MIKSSYCITVNDGRISDWNERETVQLMSHLFHRFSDYKHISALRVNLVVIAVTVNINNFFKMQLMTWRH